MNKKQSKVAKINKLRLRTSIRMIAALLFLGFISFLFTEKHYFIGLVLLWAVFELYIDISFIRPLESELWWIMNGLLSKDSLEEYRDEKFLYSYVKACIDNCSIRLNMDVADFYNVVTKEIEKNCPNKEFYNRPRIRSFMHPVTEEFINEEKEKDECVRRYRNYADIWAKGTVQLNLVFKKGKLSRIYYSNIDE